MLSLIRTSADSSPVELLRECVSRATLTEAVEKINASETTDSKIIEIFDLKFNTGTEWVLAEDSLADVPTILRRNLHDLHYALYDTHSEATCRIAVDIMLIQCRKYLRDKYQSAEPNTSVPSPPPKAAANTQPLKHVKLFPEASISIEMCNESVPNSKFLVTGRADRALGYGTAGDEGTLLVAMEAKQRSEFSKGETQLIAYLAILRENRLRMRKTNVVTQGFYSDGSRFAFICITADGTIERSLIFDIEYEKGLKTVFNFIVTMMDTAMKSTPNATPTKPGPLREKEVNHFQDEVWLKVYAQIDEAMEICQMEDAEL